MPSVLDYLTPVLSRKAACLEIDRLLYEPRWDAHALYPLMRQTHPDWQARVDGGLIGLDRRSMGKVIMWMPHGGILLRPSRCAEGVIGTRNKALRSVVGSGIQELRKQLFKDNVRCSVTGQELTPDTCDIDHTPPFTFREIARVFWDAVDKLQIPVEFEPHPVFDVSVLTSEFLISSFLQYHNRVAVLRPVLRSLNRRATRMDPATLHAIDLEEVA